MCEKRLDEHFGPLFKEEILDAEGIPP